MNEQTKKRNRRIRNTIFMASSVVAVGVGCYFGSKKGFDALTKTFKNIERAVQATEDEAANIYDLLEREVIHRNVLMSIIDEARKDGVEFEHFPGIGVRFKSPTELAQIESALGKIKPTVK